MIIICFIYFIICELSNYLAILQFLFNHLLILTRKVIKCAILALLKLNVQVSLQVT